MAAAAKAPGPADARIPCPLCGGLIHPIAGRCKHCKEDVSATRSSRPASAALPALHGGPTNGHSNGHAIKQHPANAHMPVPLAVRTEEGSQPILPPRQTGRMPASGTTASKSSWKSWPVIVIAIAVLAIIAAVILMVWPQDSTTKADAKTLAPPPAPERMDTNPLPQNGPQGSVDPWKSTPDPAPAPPPAQPDIDPDDVDPPNLADPLRDPNANMAAMTGAVMKHACERLQQCPNADASDIRSLCAFGQLAAPSATPPSCNAARRCLSQIDALPCGDIDQSAAVSLMMTAKDCIEALRC